ncbi:MAG: hypothetical protein WC992_04035, partial [Acholeplasmataceae bacterium]
MDVTDQQGQTVALPVGEVEQTAPEHVNLRDLVDVTDRRGETVALPVARTPKYDYAAIRRRYLEGFKARDRVEAEAANRIWLARSLGLDDPAGIDHATLTHAVFGAELEPEAAAERIGGELQRRWEPDAYETFVNLAPEEQEKQALAASNRWGAHRPEDMGALWSMPGGEAPERARPQTAKIVGEHAEKLLGESRKRRIAYWEDELSPRVQLLGRDLARKLTDGNTAELVAEYMPRIVALSPETRLELYDYIGTLAPDVSLPWWNIVHGVAGRTGETVRTTVQGFLRGAPLLDIEGVSMFLEDRPKWEPTDEEQVAAALGRLKQGQRIEQATLAKWTREALAMVPYMGLAVGTYGASSYFEYVGRQSEELVAHGVAPEAALVASVVSGIPYAAIERVQGRQLLTTFGVGKHATRAAYMQSWTEQISHRYLRWLVQAGARQQAESIEEGLQGAVEAGTMAFFLDTYGSAEVAQAAWDEYRAALGPMGVLQVLGLGGRLAGRQVARLAPGDVARLEHRAGQVAIIDDALAAERGADASRAQGRAVYARWKEAEGAEARREVLRGAGYDAREAARIGAMFDERELGERALGPVISEVAEARKRELEQERDRVVADILGRSAEAERTEDGGRGTEDGKRKTEEDQQAPGPASQDDKRDDKQAAAVLEDQALSAGVPIDLPAEAIREQVTRQRRQPTRRRPTEQLNILELARSEVPKVYVTAEDRREPANANVHVSPRFLTADPSGMSWDQAVQYMAEHYPGLGVEADTEMSELFRLVYQGRAKDFVAQEPADQQPVFGADVEIGDVIRGDEIVVDRTADGGVRTIDGQGRVKSYPAQETVGTVTEMGHAENARTAEARERAGLSREWDTGEEIATMEPDFAVTLDARRGRRAARQKLDRFETLVRDLGEAAPGAFPVQLVAESELPGEVQEALARYRERYPDARPKGVRTAEAVYLVPENLAGETELLGTWLHEQVVHVGLRQALGDRLDAVLDEVATVVGPEGLRSALPEAYHDQGARVQAEEYLARVAEKVLDRESLSEPERTAWQRVVDWLRRLLGEMLGRDELAGRIAEEMDIGGAQALRLAAILRDGIRGIRDADGQEQGTLLFDMAQGEFGGLLDEVAAKRVEQRAAGIAEAAGVPEWVRATARNVAADIQAGRVTDYAAAMRRLDRALEAAGRQQQRIAPPRADAQPGLFGNEGEGSLFSMAEGKGEG